MKISGFSIVRNAVRLEYPFRESVQSILPLCDEFILSVGDSSDDTLSECSKLAKENPKVRLIETHWSTDNQSSGMMLKEKTNECLHACRNPWAFYIQADEVVHESDFEPIRRALEGTGPQTEALVFDYLHFYGDFRHTIRGRSWYRREVRLFRTGLGISSFRDAQGFRRDGAPLKAKLAGARVFHYGYVRSPNSLKKKAEAMTQWWGASPGSDYRLRRHVGLRPFAGTHPEVMKNRIAAHPNDFNPRSHPMVWDRKELKDAVTLLWESVVPYRIGEFKNFSLAGGV